MRDKSLKKNSAFWNSYWGENQVFFGIDLFRLIVESDIDYNKW